VLLPVDAFSEIVTRYLGEGTWIPTWIARYTVVDTERSIIANLGYVIAGTRY
jgi:hypothetical protein